MQQSKSQKSLAEITRPVFWNMTSCASSVERRDADFACLPRAGYPMAKLYDRLNVQTKFCVTFALRARVRYEYEYGIVIHGT